LLPAFADHVTNCTSWALSVREINPLWGAVSLSCLSNSRSVAQPYRCRVSGATGAIDCTPIHQGWNRS